MSSKKRSLPVSRQFPIRQTPELLNILLKDRSTKKNIIWATDSYVGYGKNFLPQNEIKNKIIAQGGEAVVQPRMKKHIIAKSIRTKVRAEVFTPTWIVKKQNDLIEKEFENLNLENYIEKKWLEITCGEAPYICSRYDSVTGEPVSISNRVGFLDRKIQRISQEIENQDDWIKYVEKALKSTYGYEYHGDSLFIARENILHTVIDYHLYKFNEIPQIEDLKRFATIISYNVIQMDGLKYTVPYTEQTDIKHKDLQLSLFEIEDKIQSKEVLIQDGKKAIIKDWINNKEINFEEMLLGGKTMKFDVVIGNPPYQENNKERNRDDAIYPFFYDAAEKISERYILISPARFLFGVGSTPKSWNERMLNDKHIKVIYYNQNSSEVFANTDIKGGVSIIYRDSTRYFEPIETFTVYEELNSILKKVSQCKENKEEFGSLMYVQTKFDLDILYKDFPEYRSMLGSDGRERRLTSSIFSVLPNLFFNNKEEVNYSRIYGRENNERVYKWVADKYLEKGENFDNYKVFVPAANGTGEFGEILSQPIVSGPNTGHTQTFISIGNFNTEFEANSLLKYLKSKFLRAMLGVKKTTQNNKTKETWSQVPVQDFTKNSDIDWTKEISEIDQQLYSKYNLSKKEIEFIENNVKEMD